MIDHLLGELLDREFLAFVVGVVGHATMQLLGNQHVAQTIWRHGSHGARRVRSNG
jgi:hypothetical protein